LLFGPEITSKLIKIYLVTESLPKSVQYLINNRKISLFLSKKIFTVFRDKFEKDAKLKKDEGAQKSLEALTKFLRFIEATGNISLSENFQLSFKALKLALSNPKKYIVLSHLYLAINSKVDFYVASKLLYNKSKKLFEEIADSKEEPDEFAKEQIVKIENSLKVTTFQEFFQTYMKLELEDIAYDSKKFDFYIDDGADDEWNCIELNSPQIFSAEFFRLKSKNEIEKKSKTIKRYGLSKFGRRRVKKRRVYNSLLNNIEYSASNSLRPEFVAEASYIQFEKFNSINRVYQRIKGLQVEEKPLVFLDSSLVFQFLLEFEANDSSFPLWFVEKILNRFKFFCLPGVLYDLEKVGYNEFVREFLKKIINLLKLLEIENFLKIYQNKLSEYGFNNLNIDILSNEEYWRFYVQFHACLAKFLNSSYLLIPLDLKKYYFNKNYYTGKFSIFNEIEFNATFLECLTAKKFRKRFKVNKEKATKTEKESNNLEDFVVSSNFKEWAIPNCLNEVLKELDRKLIEEVNSFWLETFRNEENQEKNEVYFNDFFELIRNFEKNKNILKELLGYSTSLEEQEYYRTNFTDIDDYIRALKKNFEYFVDINDNRGVINSEELYFLLFLFESTIANFLKDRFYLKAKHKSPTLPTSINFNLFYKDLDSLSLDKKFNYQLNQLQLSNSINGPNNNAQKINVKSKKRNKRIIEFVPNLQYNDKLIVLLFEKFLFSRYAFHKSELNAIYREFIKFIRAKKEYRNIAKGFSYNKFETLLKNSYEKILTLIEPYDIYYSKRLEDILLLVNAYHRVRDDMFPLELAAKILNISETELEILIYFLIQNGQMYREKTSLHPKYSLFFQAVKELHTNYSEYNKNASNLVKAIPRILYTPFCLSNKDKNAISSQPELWIEDSKDVLDNAPIYSINAKNRVSYANQLFEVEIKGETFATDVDTGAFKSLLSKEIADRLFPNKTRFKAYVSGYTQNIKCVEMIKDIPFYFNGHKFADDFLIEEDIERIFKVEVVIGRDGYNKMLTQYYGKTLDTLFEKDNTDEKTNEVQIPIANEKIYRNSSNSNLDKEGPNSRENTCPNSSLFMPFNEDMLSNKDINPEEIPSLPPELEMSLDILLSDKALEKDVFTITEKVMQVDDQKEELTLTLTEKIQVKWTPEISNLCYSTKNVYNFGNFVMRKLFFIKNKNPNCSWDDFLKIRQSIMPDPSIKNYAQKREVLLGAFDGLKKGIRYKNGTQIKNSLNTLLKFSKFYNDTGYAQISQQILQVLGSNWLTYFTNTKLFYQGELDYRPQIPGFLKPDGEFMAIFTGQLMRQRKDFCSHIEQTKRTTKYKKYRKITSEILFPKRHENIFPHVRVRYEILQNLKEVRVIPHGNYYEIEIRYKRFVEDVGLNRNKAFSIDLGVNNPFAIANNFGAQPLLIKGREYKRANYIINRDSPYYRSIQGVYGDILKKVKKEEEKIKKKTVLQIIQEKSQKYIKNYQWKVKVAVAILTNPTIKYNQFKNLYNGSKKLKDLFNYLKELTKNKNKTTTTPIKDYLFYEKRELNRKQSICNDLKNDLKGKLENTHVQRVKELQLQNQIILDGLFKIYRNKTRDSIHKMSRYLIDLCKKNNVGTIVIGYNEGWKTRSKLSKAINRRFIPLPFYKLIESIRYKAILVGINVIVQEESYTSKCSALDNEAIEFHLNYDGVRNPTIRGKDGVEHKHYGQFYSEISDKYIHSDVNGAFNIGRKGTPSLFNKIPQNWMLIPPKRIAVT